jgi:hypothetical protein
MACSSRRRRRSSKRLAAHTSRINVSSCGRLPRSAPASVCIGIRGGSGSPAGVLRNRFRTSLDIRVGVSATWSSSSTDGRGFDISAVWLSRKGNGSPQMLLLCSPGVTVNEPAYRVNLKVLRQTFSDLGVDSDEKIALHLGVDKTQFHRQLNLDGHISWTRLCNLPRGFWSCYGWNLAVEYGLPRNAQRAARLAFALIGRKRMARAVTESVDRRRSA